MVSCGCLLIQVMCFLMDYDQIFACEMWKHIFAQTGIQVHPENENRISFSNFFHSMANDSITEHFTM